MKTIAVAALAAFSAAALFAAPATTNVPPFDPLGNITAEQAKLLTPAQLAARKAHFEKLIYQHTGGRVVKPGSQQGRIVYVNAQKKAEAKWLRESADYLVSKTGIRIEIQEGGEFSFPSPKLAGELTVYVVDDEKLPPLLAAPESRWAMVNVRTLDAGGKRAFFEARVKKELTRAVVLVGGGMDSNYPCNCVGAVAKTTDLDSFIDHMLPVDVIVRLLKNMPKYGVKPVYEDTYANACRRGWAPAPTNDVQKAVFERVRSEKERGPANAMRIPPPKASKK